MKNYGNVSVLILGYQRPANIQKLLSLCKNLGIENIYVSIDGPKFGDSSAVESQKHIVNVLDNFRKDFNGNFYSSVRRSNVGCAASVLSSIDWFFRQVDYGVILEDDCMPSEDFFKFASYMKLEIDRNEKIWIACGTQFAPSEVTGKSSVVSSYALTWGWMTSNIKWKEIRESLFNNFDKSNKKSNILNVVENQYWKAGANRAYKGITDVWDTVLLYRMRIENKFAILPNQNLVSNIGMDDFATHTKVQTPFLNMQIGTLGADYTKLNYSTNVDYWLRTDFYKISFRHLISTRITAFFDFISYKDKHKQGLLQKWLEAEII